MSLFVSIKTDKKRCGRCSERDRRKVKASWNGEKLPKVNTPSPCYARIVAFNIIGGRGRAIKVCNYTKIKIATIKN